MIDGMEEFVGRKLTPEVIAEYEDMLRVSHHILTRPDDCGENIHINMYVLVDENFTVTDVDGDKCYSAYRGMYNRSSKVIDRPFSKKDLAYLKRFLKSITSPSSLQ